MKDYHSKKYNRQFVTSPVAIEKLNHWQHAKFPDQNFHVYAHPDLELTKSRNDKNGTEFILLGFAIDPSFPEYKNDDVLEKITKQVNSIQETALETIKLAGRFVLFAKIQDNIYVFHDAGGLRTVYYAYYNDNTYLATQPLIFSEVLNLEPSENSNIYKNSIHYKNDTEYWLPCGITLYKNVHQLTPSHYYDFSERKQVRYWPNKKIKPEEIEKATIEASEILKKLMLAGSIRSKLALSLTAGLDSRILLAASKSIINDIYVFTSKFDSHKNGHYDLLIPKSILRKIKIQHNLIDCTNDVEKEFYNCYKNNVDLAHDSWVKVIYGMFNNLPKKKVVVQGTISEVTRGPLNPEGLADNNPTCDQIFLYYWKEWKEIPFIMDHIHKWFAIAKEHAEKSNMNVLDLFLLEQRTGSWNAQANNEVDILTDTFTPFNYRPLLELMLGVHPELRRYEFEILHINIIKYLWPELLYWPINKAWSRKIRIKYFVASKLKKVGLYEPASKIYYHTHPHYMKLKKALHLD